jgi:hypothetical protein
MFGLPQIADVGSAQWNVCFGPEANSAAAQVVIPYGDYGSNFEKYLIAAVSLAAPDVLAVQGR